MKKGTRASSRELGANKPGRSRLTRATVGKEQTVRPGLEERQVGVHSVPRRTPSAPPAVCDPAPVAAFSLPGAVGNFVEQLHNWLRDHAHDDRKEANLTTSREGVRAVYQALLRGDLYERQYRKLNARVARAYVLVTEGQGPELTRLRRAVRGLWHAEDGAAQRKRPKFEAIDVAESYYALTTLRGPVQFRTWVDRALGRPGRVVDGPLTPDAAVTMIKELYDFQSVAACRRFLLRVRQRALAGGPAAGAGPADPQWANVAAWLSTLSRSRQQ